MSKLEGGSAGFDEFAGGGTPLTPLTRLAPRKGLPKAPYRVNGVNGVVAARRGAALRPGTSPSPSGPG